jgi:hypothetical protein
MNLVDIIAGVNLVLIFGSFFIAMGLIIDLGGGGYILAKGWLYILPAILVFSIAKAIDFFYEYGMTTPARTIREAILVIFSILIFVGLLVQYLAIREVIASRNK